ncbi:MAG: polysaccharide biosynthesis protein, partial [Pseudomonadales bacterium]|nr:polysaccharide biosynthesis protein [Pseudomonadales bacterium]
MLATFVTLPITIRYLGVQTFGVWATLLSIVSWATFFDLGIGHGLKNKIAEAITRDDPASVSAVISTAYGTLGLVSFILFLLLVGLSYLVPLEVVFNATWVDPITIRDTAVVLAFFVILNFWLGLINQIYHGIQRSSVVVMGQFLSNSLALVTIYFFF